MATLSAKKLTSIENDLRESFSDEEVKKVNSIITSYLNLDAHLEKQREFQRRVHDRLKGATGSTYSESDKSYYQRNKASLNKKRTELNRRKHAEESS
jgi:hypothetical protein